MKEMYGSKFVGVSQYMILPCASSFPSECRLKALLRPEAKAVNTFSGAISRERTQYLGETDAFNWSFFCEGLLLGSPSAIADGNPSPLQKDDMRFYPC